MPPARILVVTNGQLSRNPRALKEAESLGRAGHDVTVLMVRNHAGGERDDAALARHAPWRREAVDLLPGYAAGAGRLLARRGLSWLARKAGRILPPGAPEALGPARALLGRARRLPADLAIVHNEVAHWVGLRLLDAGRRVAADIEDWHSEDLLPESRRARPLGLIRANERALLRRMAYASTTSDALADALHARYGGTRPIVLTNSFPLQADPRRAFPNNPPAFFWFSQTIGPGRGLELFLAAWARTVQASRLVLLGEPAPGYRDKLLGRLPADRRDRLVFLPLVPPGELPAVIARHDLGLALEQDFIVNRDLTVTNKILQYLNAGLGVVASDTAGQREVLGRAPGAGVLVAPAQTGELAAQLDALLADRDRLSEMSRAARRAAEERYCWERETPRLLAAVEAALRRPGLPSPP